MTGGCAVAGYWGELGLGRGRVKVLECGLAGQSQGSGDWMVSKCFSEVASLSLIILWITQLIPVWSFIV